MRRQASRNLGFTPGTSPAKSFFSFSDTRISTSLQNVGFSLGKNNNDINMPVGVLKPMEIGRLRVSPRCNSTLPNTETEEEDERMPNMMVCSSPTWLVVLLRFIWMMQHLDPCFVTSQCLRGNLNHTSRKRNKSRRRRRRVPH